MTAMTIRVKLFAILRDQVGLAETDLELEHGATVATALHVLGERYPQVRPTLPRTAKAVNLNAAKDETVLNPGDELALLPPVSGG